MYRIGVKTIEEILEKLNEIPTVKGSISAGALPKYFNKDDSLFIVNVTEGGFAEDIYFYKDYDNEAISSAYTFLSMFVSGGDSEFDKDTYSFPNITHNDWFVKQGNGGNPWVEISNSLEEMIIFNNGKWWVIDKIENGEVIPMDIAIRIDDRAASEVSNKTIDNDGESLYVNVKEFADKIKELGNYSYEQSLLSKWEQDDLLHLMINTNLNNNYYLYNRTDNKITITCYVNFKGVLELKSKATEGFKIWQDKTYLDNSQYVELGNQEIKLEINIIENENGIPVKLFKDDSLYTDGGVENNTWNTNNVGEMNLTEGKDNYEGYFKFIAAHELGHVMGLGDAYDGAYKNESLDIDYIEEEVAKNSIMYGVEALRVEGSYVITPQDIEMIQYANVLCEKQYFYGSKRSIGITVK